MPLTPLQWTLAAATVIAEILLLTAMSRSRLRAKYPVFFNYIIFYLISLTFFMFATPRISPAQYFYAYWSLMAVGMCLGFGALYEVFVHILKPYQALADFAKLLFGWVLAFLLLASVLTAIVTSGSQPHRICTAIDVCERSVELMQCGFLLLLVLFATRLGLSWRSPAVSVMTGIGILAALDLSGSYLVARIPVVAHSWDVMNALCCLAINVSWFLSMTLPQPQRRSAEDSPARLILQRWNEAILATPLVRRNNEAALPVESFLPGVERAVERVMARRISN